MSNKQWKEFWLSGDDGVFKLKATASGIDGNKLNLEGKEFSPYISRKGSARASSTNGVKQFIPEKQGNHKRDTGNCITIGLDTQTVFYQSHSFFTGQNIQVLRNAELNKNNALFFTEIIRKQMEKFNWGGNGATLGRLARTKILLPVDNRGLPDFNYMESIIVNEETKKIANYNEFVRKELMNIKYKEIPKLQDKTWKPFKIEDLFSKFEQGKSKGLNHLDTTNGTTPYLGATNRNNGILTFIVDNSKMTQMGNCIGFIRNGQGSVGYAIYKASKFVSTSDITFAYSSTINKFTGNFIVTLSNMARCKYSHGYKRSNNRLKRDSIMLPIDSKGNPDYEYMEQYIKNLMLRKYQDYLSFKE